MKIRRYEKDNEAEPVVTLALRNDVKGSVTVLAVGSDGLRVFGGDLLRFNKDGTITPASGISFDLGFRLDQHQRIKVML